MKKILLYIGLAIASLSINAQTNCGLINSITLNAPTTQSKKTFSTVGYLQSGYATPIPYQDIKNNQIWHNIVVTKSGLNGNIYIDGNLLTSSTYSDVPYIWHSLLLGATQACVSCSPVPNYTGLIDEVRVSNVVRTADEIKSNFNSNQPLNADANTLGLFHFDSPKETYMVNSAGNDGIFYGGVSYTQGKFGQAASFDGIDDYARFTNSIPVNNMTVEFWFKSTDDDASMAMLEYAYNTGIYLKSTTSTNIMTWSNGETGESITINPQNYNLISVTDGNCTQTVYFNETSATNSLIINTGALNTIPITYNNTVTIYPNPANDHITIDCGNLANVSGWTIKIVNTLGQEVFSGAMDTQQYFVPLNSWSGQGFYIVNIYDASNKLLNTKKIILQ